MDELLKLLITHEIMKSMAEKNDSNDDGEEKLKNSIPLLRISFEVGSNGIGCSMSGSKKALELLGATKWAEETASLLRPNIEQQAGKLTKIVTEKLCTEVDAIYRLSDTELKSVFHDNDNQQE